MNEIKMNASRTDMHKYSSVQKSFSVIMSLKSNRTSLKAGKIDSASLDCALVLVRLKGHFLMNGLRFRIPPLSQVNTLMRNPQTFIVVVVVFYYRGTYESFGTKLVQVTLDSRSRTKTRARLRLLTIRSELLDLDVDVVDNSNDDGNDGVSLAHWETSPSRAPDCRRIASDFELRLKKAKEMQPCSTNHVCAPPHD